jgi:hypothetical protein
MASRRRTTMKPEIGRDTFTILARNQDGFVAPDGEFPARFARVVGCRQRAGDLLPFNCMTVEELRMWAVTFEEAADKLEAAETADAETPEAPNIRDPQ